MCVCVCVCVCVCSVKMVEVEELVIEAVEAEVQVVNVCRGEMVVNVTVNGSSELCVPSTVLNPA